jgi:hypothetical protein
MDFNTVLNGVVKYVDKEIIPNMNAWQELIARVGVARIINNAEAIKSMLTNNAFAKTFSIADQNGNIDVDGIVADIKKVMSEKGCIEVDVPMFGHFKFVDRDVDKLYSYIRGI